MSIKNETTSAINKIISIFHQYPYRISLLVMSISACFIFFSFKSIIPSKSIITRNRFSVLEKRINLLVNSEPEKKISLSSLPQIKGLDNSILDGWNNSIIFKVTGDNNYLLLSYGEDGVKGGEADLRYLFNLKKNDAK